MDGGGIRHAVRSVHSRPRVTAPLSALTTARQQLSSLSIPLSLSLSSPSLHHLLAPPYSLGLINAHLYLYLSSSLLSALLFFSPALPRLIASLNPTPPPPRLLYGSRHFLLLNFDEELVMKFSRYSNQPGQNARKIGEVKRFFNHIRAEFTTQNDLKRGEPGCVFTNIGEYILLN